MSIDLNQWQPVLNIECIKSSTCNILRFVHYYLKENKYNVFRWKLSNFIQPCKTILTLEIIHYFKLSLLQVN